MCVMNTGEAPASLDAGRYGERSAGFSQAVDVVSGKTMALKETLIVPPMEMWVMELKK